jgi:hypothetical protein
VLDVPVSAIANSLPALDTSCQTTYSYGVVNRGKHPVIAKVEISPDNRHFADDFQDTIPGGKTMALVPYRFLRYTRISLQTAKPDENSVVDVYFQAQSAG